MAYTLLLHGANSDIRALRSTGSDPLASLYRTRERRRRQLLAGALATLRTRRDGARWTTEGAGASS
jgi:hypothetical protein